MDQLNERLNVTGPQSTDQNWVFGGAFKRGKTSVKAPKMERNMSCVRGGHFQFRPGIF